MKHFCISLLVLISLFSTAWAQHTTNPEAADMADQFVANYDSLLNTYVMNKYAAISRRHRANINTDYAFDQVADTVIARRLRSLHTVIPMTYNNVVRSYIRMYLNRMKNRMDVMLTLAEYYQPIFEESLAKYNVPEELKYLTIVESAMNPQATSRVGAAGLWQFMYTTGKNYGLEVNSIIDERRDVYKSSDAAAHYLHDLHRVFGDWQLAIAAYNCGPGNINKAISRSGGKRNFWQIYPYLPKETRGYIPAFIAATYIMNFYPEHGLHPTRVSIPLRTDTIMVERNMLFCFVNKYIGVEMDELRTLNPQYRADMIPGEGGSYPLCLPTDKMNDLISWADTIFFHSEDSLMRQNMAPSSNDESADAPTTSSTPKASGKARNNQSSGGSAYHKVRRGENLTSIAAKHGTTVAKLKKINGLKSDKIREGQRIKLR
ncbi:MAG: transglycosylase SLT domain-containing protein [Bacteroidales bacterium]|nr:transglycosylase SLT domain-containing protein [Bacteroidales bacterium]